MWIGTFTKGALAGGVGAVAVMGATAAIAGTGVGGIFNLGQTNTVNGTSTLTGSEAAPGLAVTNPNTGAGATALSLSTAATKPNLSVSNSVQIAKLNSNYVQGYARSDLARVGLGASQTLFGVVTNGTQGSVTIKAPKAGFVKVDATLVASDVFSTTCGPCTIEANLNEQGTSNNSPTVFGSVVAGLHYLTLPLTWVFTDSAGTHTYVIDTADVDAAGGPPQFYNPIITAQFIPFGSTGLATAL
jgi:hypothetical protein